MTRRTPPSDSKERLTKTERVRTIYPSELEGNLENVIALLEGLRRPEGETVLLDATHGDDGDSEFDVFVTRLENDEEYEARQALLKSIRAEKRKEKKERDEKERALYKKLKAKFERTAS